MTKFTDEMNWDEFNETEQNAIAIDCENMRNGTNNPTFPFSAVVFEELAQNLAIIALVRPNSALKMMNELIAMNKVLLKLAPTPPTKDENELMMLLTEDEIKQNLLGCNVCHFLVQQFLNVINQIETAQLMAIAEGGKNGTKH